MPSIASRARGERAEPRRRAGLLLGILPPLAFLLYALTLPGLTRGDAAGVYTTAAALVERASFSVDGAIAGLAPAATADSPSPATGSLAYAAGHFYHAAPPGPALLAAPLFTLGKVAAPLLGPEAPALFAGLLGPLLGALVVAGLARVVRGPSAQATADALGTTLVVMAGALLALPLSDAPSAPIAAAALVVWLAPASAALRRRATPLRALAVGLGLAAFLLLDYGLGLLALLPIGAFAVRLRGTPAAAAAILVGAAPPAAVLALHNTVAYGRPWRPGFRFATERAQSPLFDIFALEVAAAVLVALLLVLAATVVAAPESAWPPLTRRPVWLALLAVCGLGVWGIAVRSVGQRDEIILPYDWRAPAGLLLLVGCAALLGGALALPPWERRRLGRGVAAPAALALVLLALGVVSAGEREAATVVAGENFAAPFAVAAGDGFQPVWTVDPATRFTDPLRLPLAARARAVGPWLDVTPGVAYRLRLEHSGAVRVLFAWEDAARRPLVQQVADESASGTLDRSFAAPLGAAGLRLHLIAGDDAVTVANPRLTVAAGVPVSPFPDYQRAALAFSFDWESAMGGLIHSRSAGGEGAGATVGLTADGSPSVAEAEAKALRMRAGAAFLADQFARHDIRATFYATGYNLLEGNPTCEKFLDDPLYPNADARNGWGSDYWKSHRWYEHDPCATEAEAPAWYFASRTRELAAAGHEIASHTFGHLYVRGVKPEQLEADLALWERAARGLGVSPAYSFAFPWTSSNSLDGRFFAVFERRGLTVLTRVYPTDLKHPYELVPLKDAPQLTIFPDQYLPSTAAAREAALRSIDQTVARRGYHSLWTHPNEVLEQGGPAIWPRVIDYAAAARERGLWVAPVTEIARYSLATRQIGVIALPVAGGLRLTVENQSGHRLDGLTIALPAPAARVTVDGRESADARGDQLRLPPLEPGARVVVVARR